jgi:16S rRNA C1402 (ribose-2'-O) methylase RsmI
MSNVALKKSGITMTMPVISSKVTAQELDAVAEYANRHGITISNLIRMVLVREISGPWVLTGSAATEMHTEEREKSIERPCEKPLLERMAESHRMRQKANQAEQPSNTLYDLLLRGRRRPSRPKPIEIPPCP